jgi:thiol-disulfide isomerase/thioredoxin
MDYKLKYEKYKFKYMKLKKKLTFNQNGGSLKPELYLFKAEWCGHCNKFKPEWEKLINNDNLKNKINFITMDSEINKTEMAEWKIEGFPTIILKINNNAIEYSGNRTVNAIEEFIHNNI